MAPHSRVKAPHQSLLRTARERANGMSIERVGLAQVRLERLKCSACTCKELMIRSRTIPSAISSLFPLQTRLSALTHEDFSRLDEIKPSSDRSFGLVVAAFFLIVALWPFIRTEPVRWWALGVAAIFAVLALLWTRPSSIQQTMDEVRTSLLYYRQSGGPWPLILPDGHTIALMMRLFQRILCDCAGSPMPRAIGSKGSPPGLAPEFMKN